MRNALIALAIVVASTPTEAAPPGKVGTCAKTTIRAIGSRFSETLVKPKPGVEISDGTTIELANDTYGVSYQFVEEVYNSKVGDRVVTCLIALPENCPKGDDRGRLYTTTNLRTLASWTLSDSQHSCGGA